jgi:hypothetical protein
MNVLKKVTIAITMLHATITTVHLTALVILGIEEMVHFVKVSSGFFLDNDRYTFKYMKNILALKEKNR